MSNSDFTGSVISGGIKQEELDELFENRLGEKPVEDKVTEELVIDGRGMVGKPVVLDVSSVLVVDDSVVPVFDKSVGLELFSFVFSSFLFCWSLPVLVSYKGPLFEATTVPDTAGDSCVGAGAIAVETCEPWSSNEACGCGNPVPRICADRVPVPSA